MKFFLDECLPLSLTKLIEEFGFKAEHARTAGLRGASDREIIKYVKKQKAILITKDLEFGNLLIYPKGSHNGLIILRLPYYYTTAQIKEVLKNFLTQVDSTIIINAITVLEVGRYRIRKLIH